MMAWGCTIYLSCTQVINNPHTTSLSIPLITDFWSKFLPIRDSTAAFHDSNYLLLHPCFTYDSSISTLITRCISMMVLKPSSTRLIHDH